MNLYRYERTREFSGVTDKTLGISLASCVTLSKSDLHLELYGEHKDQQLGLGGFSENAWKGRSCLAAL